MVRFARTYEKYQMAEKNSIIIPLRDKHYHVSAASFAPSRRK